MQALQGVTRAIREATEADALLEICQRMDEKHVEHADSWPHIRTPEVFYLRVEWADRCRALLLRCPQIIAVLSRFVQDREPDTYPMPFFDQQGPEWTAPSKWKVRISSAYSIGILGGIDCVPLLLRVWCQERVEPVRMAIALATLSCSGSDSLQVYLAAAEKRDKKTALEALAMIAATGNSEIDTELKELRRKIETY